jgi:hypothetical protein
MQSFKLDPGPDITSERMRMDENTSRFDGFYLKEDHATNPKEYFKSAVSILKSRIGQEDFSALDIGCAAGDFMRYLSVCFPRARLNGLDAFQPLLDEAQKRVPRAKFYCQDMNAPNAVAEKFQVVTMLGTLSIFTTTQWVRNFSSLLTDDGFGLIFGMVNPYPYDVFVRLQRSSSGKDEYGWNSWSASTLKTEFLADGWQTEVEYWEVPIDVPQREEDPLRSWTIKREDGGRLVTNGARMVHDFAFVKIFR